MPTSDLITPQHLSRKALIYVRQSTPHQVLSHQESQRLPGTRLRVSLAERAVALGWRREDVHIVDADLGLTATAAEHRQGFKEVVAQVSLGEVGIVLSYEVARMSRNCSDWYPLLDVCGFRACLIADDDGIYDPGSANGRLLLGLKGQLSEYELHTLRARLTAGLLNKARRGELALQLPVGLMRDALGRVTKDPNREVQDRLQLVFTTFLQARSASKVVQHFQAHALLLPRRDRFGAVVWKLPTVASILAVLKNPAYSGAFVYGRTRMTSTGPLPTDKRQRPLPMEDWKIRVNDVYPAYIPWDTFVRIQAMVQDNHAEYDRNKTRGIPRPGKALLHGIVYCGACGHKMVVQYKSGTRYICNALRQQYHVPVCQYIPADPVDDRVVAAFFQAFSAVDLDAYAQAVAHQQTQREQFEHAHRQQVDRLRYEAALAERQFLRADPENRLVAAELETRWEGALRALKQAQEDDRPIDQPPPLLPLPPDLQARFQAVGHHLPQLWQEGLIDQVQKKALLRCLIDKVVVQRATRDTVEMRIVWTGGESTLLSVPVPVGAWNDLTEAATMEQLILDQSTAGLSDEEIARALTAQGYRSPLAQEVLPSTVQSVRLRHRLFQKRSQSHPRHIPGSLTVPQLARALDLTPHWIYDRIQNGTIEIAKDPASRLFLFPDTPATLDQFQQLKDGTLKTLRF